MSLESAILKLEWFLTGKSLNGRENVFGQWKNEEGSSSKWSVYFRTEIFRNAHFFEMLCIYHIIAETTLIT